MGNLLAKKSTGNGEFKYNRKWEECKAVFDGRGLLYRIKIHILQLCKDYGMIKPNEMLQGDI